METLKTICENESVSSEISEIISCTDSKRTKARRLKTLRDSCKSPLARSHAEYYIEALRKEQRKSIKRTVLALFSLSYLIFTLCRVWWYYRPEHNPFPETNNTVVDLRMAIYFVTIVATVLLGVRKAVLSVKAKNK